MVGPSPLWRRQVFIIITFIIINLEDDNSNDNINKNNNDYSSDDDYYFNMVTIMLSTSVIIVPLRDKSLSQRYLPLSVSDVSVHHPAPQNALISPVIRTRARRVVARYTNHYSKEIFNAYLDSYVSH